MAKFERITGLNRWKQRRYSRNSDWVILGVQRWCASPKDYCIKFCFFGFELSIWFEK